ncbi:MAG: amino acid adenylation domain-containing protein, partial [Flavobacteriales bacterium]|nr:amino acid adenylation domain-containing protein [Flavobacteriales bacterium]
MKSDYRDYVIEQKMLIESEEVRNYWISELSDFKKSDLPFHKKNNGVDDVLSVELLLSADLKSKVSEYLDTTEVTKKAFFLSVLSKLIGVTTGEKLVTIGLSANSRPALEDGDKILACFTNGIPFRVSVTDSLADLPSSIEEKLRNLKKFEGLAYYDIRSILRENDDYHGDFYDVMYNYTDFHVVNDVSDEYRGQHTIVAGYEKTNSPFLVQLVHMNGDYRIGINLEKSLYNDAEINCIKSYFTSIVEIIVGEREEKDGLLSQQEKDQLTSFNATQTAYPKNKTVIDLFEEQVVTTPDSTAVVFEDSTLSYSDLDQLSNQLSNYLISNYNITTEDLVGIKLERSEWLIVSILATLKSGGAYVPIDPSYPEDRIAYIEQDTQCKVCIDENELKAFMTFKDEYATSLPPRTLTPDNLAYIIYTSGSTGTPKGVMIQHSNASALIHWSDDEFSADAFDRALFVTSHCFDLSVYEIFYPLTKGKVLEVVENGLAIPNHLLNNDRVLVNTVPSVVGSLLSMNADLSSVSILNMAGEPIPKNYLKPLLDEVGEVRNLYGPSEDTTYSTCYRITDPEVLTIGEPIANTEALILNDTHELQPIGVIGEICLGGDGLARGYLNNEALTQEKFIVHPFKEGERLYKTGDLGRWLEDGNIEFVGRKDDQVKIRGYRIELGEIEHALSQIPSIESSVVVV